MADIYIGNVKGPQGDTGATGPQGAAGDAATIQVGTVSTTAYGNPAQVNNSGTEHAAVLNFVIPQGAPGATVTQLDNLALNTITTSTDQYPQIQVGDLGRVIFGKIIKFFQDLVTGLAAKVNYSDALTLEEIEASSDLTDKVSAAAASKSLKDALTRTTALNVYGGGVLERCSNVRVLTYANQSWNPSGTALAASDRPHFSSQVWGTVTVGSDTSNSYRIKVSNTGVVVLQKNGSDLSATTSDVRGQVVWIV